MTHGAAARPDGLIRLDSSVRLFEMVSIHDEINSVRHAVAESAVKSKAHHIDCFKQLCVKVILGDPVQFSGGQFEARQS